MHARIQTILIHIYKKWSTLILFYAENICNLTHTLKFYHFCYIINRNWIQISNCRNRTKQKQKLCILAILVCIKYHYRGGYKGRYNIGCHMKNMQYVLAFISEVFVWYLTEGYWLQEVPDKAVMMIWHHYWFNRNHNGVKTFIRQYRLLLMPHLFKTLPY